MNIKNLFVLLLALLALSSPVQANDQPSAYTAELPPQIFSDPDLCAYAPCKEVVPGADRFSSRMGKPAYVEAFKGDQKIGYAVLSTDVTDLPAYSGKPIITLIGLDTKGVIVGVKVLKHSEPILLVGIPESKLLDYVKQYVGKKAEDKLEIGASNNKDVVSIDAISGATVTVIVENQVIALSAFEVAHQAGIISLPTKPQAKFAKVDERFDWATLMQEGAVQQLTITQKELGLDGEGAHVDIHFGYLNTPAIGRSILGDEAYEWLMAELKPGEHAMFIVSNGAGSFKGSGFVRGGIYERVQIKQD
ncbi:MAG: FMN-binding protein, partial [Gallionellaceae bacterium]|nr:FMN-binding protein [Gallionellaceae bacterium]